MKYLVLPFHKCSCSSLLKFHVNIPETTCKGNWYELFWYLPIYDSVYRMFGMSNSMIVILAENVTKEARTKFRV